MKDFDSILEQLRNNVSLFLFPLKTDRTINVEAFSSLCSVLDEVVRIFKNEQLLPKALLWEIRCTYLSIQAEMDNMKDNVDKLAEMANEIEMYFSILLRGETKDDRTPGKPRII
jgi:hypothetical protein